MFLRVPGIFCLGHSIEVAVKQKLIVIGSGMVGSRFIERLIKLDPNRYDICVFNKEPTGGYNRIMLSPVLSGETPLNEIMTHDHDWFKRRQVTLYSNTEIQQINQPQQTVKTADGQTHSYDKLVIATGSKPFILPVDGVDLENVISFREVRDVERMVAISKTHKLVAIIGGGLLGLEAANGLAKLGMQVSVIHRSAVLMNMQMDSVSGELLKQSIEQNGIQFFMQANTQRLIGNDFVTGVELDNGEVIPADLVVMAVGIRPNVGLAKNLGLAINRGIIVNDTMQTSAPNIYALGECVEHRGQVYGLVAPLYEQANVLANVFLDKADAYLGSVVSTKLKVTGINLFSAGYFHEFQGSQAITYQDLSQKIYRKIILNNNKIQGMVMFGDVSGSNWLMQQLEQQNNISKYRDTLIFGEGFSPSNSVNADLDSNFEVQANV